MTPRKRKERSEEETAAHCLSGLSRPKPTTAPSVVARNTTTEQRSNVTSITHLPIPLRLEIYSYLSNLDVYLDLRFHDEFKSFIRESTSRCMQPTSSLAFYLKYRRADERIIGAARLGDFHALMYMKAYAHEIWTSHFKINFIFLIFARYGHIQAVHWAVLGRNFHPDRLFRPPYHKSLPCALAAESGNLKLLQFLRQEDFPWDEDTCACAAGCGDLKVLQWARDQGCPWDKWTCARASIEGKLDALQWAQRKKCPWDKRICITFAKSHNYSDMVAWMKHVPDSTDWETIDEDKRKDYKKYYYENYSR